MSTHMREPSVQPGTRDGGWTPRLVLSLVSIILILELLTVSYLMVSTALPSISQHYRTTQGAWLLTSMLLVGAVSAPLLGKLADMYGKRKMLLTCLVLATIGSVLSAIAPSFAVMVTGRALGGFLVPTLFLSYSLIRDVFPASKVAFSVSIATSGMGLISIAAPFLTGWLLDNWGFRAIFWFMVIVVVVLGPIVALTTAESSVRLRSRVDLLGAILLGAGLAGVLVGVSNGPSWGWTSSGTLTYLLGGAVLLVVWVISATLVREPLVDLRLLRHRSIGLTTIAAGASYGCSAVYTMLLPMMAMTPAMLGLHYGFGVNAEQFALYSAPIGAFTMIGGVLVGLTSRRISPRLMIVAGNIIMAIGFTLTAFSHTSKPLVILFAAIFGFGMGLCYAAVPNIIIASVAPQYQATTAGVVAASQSVIPGILPVIVFAILNSNIAMVVQGNAFYTDHAMKLGFLVGAVVAVFGFLAAVALPRKITQFSLDDEPAVDSAFAGVPA